MSDSGNLQVEVVYALPDRVWRVPLVLASGSTVGDAVAASGLLDRLEDLANKPIDCGVFSQACSLNRVLQDRDRVEIYRPLLCDPKEVRRERAKR